MANDVRCGHAASVGPVDEETLFYLQSRGIPRDEAERLIVTGFFQEVLDRVSLAEVREGAEVAIQAELGRRGGRLMGAVAHLRRRRTCPPARRGGSRWTAGCVAIVNLGDEGFRAVDAVCSHERYYLDEGEVDVDDRDDRMPEARVRRST